MGYNKYITIERHLTKSEIECILRDHFERELESMDVDFRDAKWINDDFTYNFKEGSPSIEVNIMIDDCKLRKK